MGRDLWSERWDAIVIGSGMGGGTAGRHLAERGMKVLFVEMGGQGHRTEQTPFSDQEADPLVRSSRGFWPFPVSLSVDGAERQVHPPVGSGLGGSSVFYAGTLERPERHDLDHSEERPHPTGGWPVGFDAMLPWFDAAQRMYHVSGSPDPLSETPSEALGLPPALPRGDAAIMDRLRRSGLNPYRLHSAIRHLDGCLDCIGRKCPRACKMDSRSAGVEPALATGRAALLDRARVTRLIAGPDRVQGVEILHQGETRVIDAPRVILAAGALQSPVLLMASANGDWPDGLANRSGLVGRNLMFHLNEMFAYFPGRGVGGGAGGDGPSKSVGFRDLYFVEGRRLGMVQALGVNAEYGSILHVLRQRLAARRLTRGRFWHEAARFPAGFAARLLGSAAILVGIIEDLPERENRVTADPDNPDRIRIVYRTPQELLERRALFRRRLRRALRWQPFLFLNQGPELNLGHPCGTLRMGRDPLQSVVDADCRAHGLSNLWVTDSSVFPTSMGVNPSLAIAANALRVADAIAEGRNG